MNFQISEVLAGLGMVVNELWACALRLNVHWEK